MHLESLRVLRTELATAKASTAEEKLVSDPLQGRLAIVTGGSRGIGFAIADKLAELGAEVVITARNQDELDNAATQMRKSGGKCDGIRCDVSSLSEDQQFSSNLARRLRALTIL